jgi:serine/threonine protein kinase
MHGVGIGHLDLKPSNIVLRGDTDPIIVDFGLAGRQLRPGCGTACYCAPEIWGVLPEGAKCTPLTADVYAFGCVAYEVLTGKTLFDGPSAPVVVSAHITHDGLPAPIAKMAQHPPFGHLAALISHCLRKNPQDRPNVTTLRGALRNVGARLQNHPWPLA